VTTVREARIKAVKDVWEGATLKEPPSRLLIEAIIDTLFPDHTFNNVQIDDAREYVLGWPPNTTPPDTTFIEERS
jgi:hypothetical protein